MWRYILLKHLLLHGKTRTIQEWSVLHYLYCMASVLEEESKENPPPLMGIHWWYLHLFYLGYFVRGTRSSWWYGVISISTGVKNFFLKDVFCVFPHWSFIWLTISTFPLYYDSLSAVYCCPCWCFWIMIAIIKNKIQEWRWLNCCREICLD